LIYSIADVRPPHSVRCAEARVGLEELPLKEVDENAAIFVVGKLFQRDAPGEPV
jgi:hypothetical protein